MSAFVCSEKTINGIVAFLADKHRQERIGSLYSEPITSLGYYIHFGSGCFEDELTRQKHVERLADDLHAMNVRAVKYRYPDDNTPYAFQFRAAIPPKPISAMKAMSCLRYQCAEGDIPDEPLYKALEECIHLLAERIVADSPEYQASSNWH